MFLLAFAGSIQLFPDGTMFIHIALILIMIWVLNRTFFKPINRVIESRQRHSGAGGGEAVRILRDAEEKERIFTQEMLAARGESYKLIEAQRAEALAARQSEVGRAKSETTEMLAAEKQTLANETAAERAAIAGEAEEIAERISSTILKA